MAENTASVKLPTLFRMEDYENCMQHQLLYCKVSGKLSPVFHNSTLWEEILKLEANKNLLDRSLIHRGLCINVPSSHSISLHTQQIINKELQEHNLLTEIVDVHCTNGKVPLYTMDIIFLAAVTVILGICITSSMMYKKLENRKDYFATILNAFAIQNTWKKLTMTTGNEDFEKLKGLQAIRVVTNMLVILLHTKLFYLCLFLQNPDELESLSHKPLVIFGNILDMFLVQIFLFISTFLLTNQIYTIWAKKESFTLMDVFVLVINRFFRLGVAASITVLFYNTSIVRRTGDLSALGYITFNENACQNYWLPVIFFYNNFSVMADMCNSVTWSNSADFHMYTIVSILMYLKFKFKIQEKKLMGLSVAVAVGIQGTIIYFLDLDIAVRPYIRNLEFSYFFTSQSILWLYSSTFAISTTSLFGMIFGAIYYHTKYLKFKHTWVITIIWSFGSLIFPIIAMVMTLNEDYGIGKVIVGPIIKPIFVSGIGICILGTAHNIGGRFKTIVESKGFVVFSHFTYSIYLCNGIAVMTGHSGTTTTVAITTFTIVSDYLLNVFKSCVAGGLLAVAVEQPGLTLQKLFLPQVKMSKEKHQHQ